MELTCMVHNILKHSTHSFVLTLRQHVIVIPATVSLDGWWSCPESTTMDRIDLQWQVDNIWEAFSLTVVCKIWEQMVVQRSVPQAIKTPDSTPKQRPLMTITCCCTVAKLTLCRYWGHILLPAQLHRVRNDDKVVGRRFAEKGGPLAVRDLCDNSWSPHSWFLIPRRWLSRYFRVWRVWKFPHAKRIHRHYYSFEPKVDTESGHSHPF